MFLLVGFFPPSRVFHEQVFFFGIRSCSFWTIKCMNIGRAEEEKKNMGGKVLVPRKKVFDEKKIERKCVF